MKMMKSVAVALAAAALAGTAPAQDDIQQGRPQGTRLQAGRMLQRNEPAGGQMGFAVQMLEHPRVANALKLTDAQKAQIKEKSFAQQKEMIRLRAELETAGLDQAKLLAAESPDLNALLQAVEKTGNLHTEMAKLRVKNLIEIRSILDEKQRAALKGVLAKLQERRRAEGAKDVPPGERKHGGGKNAAPDDPKKPVPAPGGNDMPSPGEDGPHE